MSWLRAIDFWFMEQVFPHERHYLRLARRWSRSADEAWQKGEIQFNGEPLDAAVAEYNRYLSRPLAIGDDSIRQIKLGGRFSNSDPSDFLRALTVIYGVQVHEEADRIRLGRT